MKKSLEISNLKTISLSCFLIFLLIKPAHSKILVVLDPGHGGRDFGSMYKKSTENKEDISMYEKDIVLDIAEKTRKILQSPLLSRRLKMPLKVILTRDKDYFLSLDERAEISRKYNTKIFISIHVNSEERGKAHGMEIYLLNNSSKESYSHHETLYQRSKKRKKKASSLPLLLRSVATDAMTLPSLLAAKQIGQSIHAQLKKDKIQLKYRGMRQALLQVLLDVHVPSLLLEVAYLSSKKDRKILRQKRSLHSIATGLATGILNYLEKSAVENYWSLEEDKLAPLLQSNYLDSKKLIQSF